jgi:hypothetical protein
VVGGCIDNAIAQLAAQLEETFPKLPPRTPVVDGLVADANGAGQLVLNVGAHDGVKLGDRLRVWRAGKEIRDPASGKVLMPGDTLLGDASRDHRERHFLNRAVQGHRASEDFAKLSADCQEHCCTSLLFSSFEPLRIQSYPGSTRQCGTNIIAAQPAESAYKARAEVFAKVAEYREFRRRWCGSQAVGWNNVGEQAGWV